MGLRPPAARGGPARVDGPVAVETILLVRHGSAGMRSEWQGDDAERPLDANGIAQAEALIWLLTRWDVREIISAPLVRCTQTVEPLSVSVGLSVQTVPLLSEWEYPEHRGETVKWLRSIGTAGTASVVCSQGDVIPDLLTRLGRDDGYDLPQPRPCKKGSLWSLTFAEDRLYAAEYFPPLPQP
ncbi:MAG: histidine phosphatase family protein [Dehalococcoidia bacterium]